MKVKRLFRRKRESKGDPKKALVNVIKDASLEDNTTIPFNNSGSSSSLSSKEENGNVIQGSNGRERGRGVTLKHYSDKVGGSSMATYARMSTTIAETLTEQEFGTQKNCLYRPNSKTYSSKVVHPVLCKRDIFVTSVTPTKPKDKRSKITSIYHVDHTEAYAVNDLKEKYQSFESVHRRNPTRNKSSTAARGRSHSQKVMTAPVNNYVRTISVSASMLFRERKKLSVETGRIGHDDNQHLPPNRHRLHFGTHGEYQRYLKTRESSSYHSSSSNNNNKQLMKCTNTSLVSPSSTISSLSLPAELDTDPTPRALFHQLMKSQPHLQSVKENTEREEMIRTHNQMTIEEDRVFDEI